ncbi:MAG: response regulator [Chitinispirillales bacterium]|jgi:response regulator RpfG family c-di-GMP phosphodiesterase|nr:response regulator [Chitinispirillales bacterium]
MEAKHLLIVDDEKTLCGLLGKYLSTLGYKVSQAFSGEQAMSILQSQPIDLVISDIEMPGISGVDLLKWMQDSNFDIPVLITTGHPTLDTAIGALKSGAQDYFTKPFHLDEIAEKVSRALKEKRLEEENLVLTKLVSLHDITKTLASVESASGLVKKLLEFSLNMVKADSGAVLLADGKSRFAVSQTSGAFIDYQFWRSRAFTIACGWVQSNNKAIIIGSEERERAAGLEKIPDGLRCCMALPLAANDKFLGTLLLVRKSGNSSFSNLDLQIVNALTMQASIFVENIKLYENIRNNYLSTIRAFAHAVEAKDEYTHGHSENVMKYTVALGKFMGISEQELEHIKYAGLLHDIGKIGISESILNKPSKLTDEEYNQIMRHPELGARIISNIPFLSPLAALVQHHHEFYNGKGYPFGLSGEEIPLGARMLSVSDTYEAMTSNRPYRKAMPQETAFKILVEEKGRQFDPVIVDAFLKVMKDGV